MIDRTHRELTDGDIAKIGGTYHAWRGDEGDHTGDHTGDHKGRPYQNVAGFCKSATLDEIRAHGYVLTPGRYVGAAEVGEDDEPFEEKMKRLTTALEMQFAESEKLETAIQENLRRLGI